MKVLVVLALSVAFLALSGCARVDVESIDYNNWSVTIVTRSVMPLPPIWRPSDPAVFLGPAVLPAAKIACENMSLMSEEVRKLRPVLRHSELLRINLLGQSHLRHDFWCEAVQYE